MLSDNEYAEMAPKVHADQQWTRDKLARLKRNWLSAQESAERPFPEVDNTMRGRVEQYELLRDLPERFGAYISADGQTVTTWTGDQLGRARCVSTWRTPGSFVSSTMGQYICSIAHRTYTGRSAGAGMFIALRETAESKRQNPRNL